MHLQGPVMGLGWVVSQAFSWTKLRVELAISFSALTREKEVFLGVRLELQMTKAPQQKKELPKNPRPISYTEYSAATHPPKQ